MRKLFYCSLLAVCCSCKQPVSVDNKAKIELLADRTCRAINIREQRFALADKIRFAQDTLMYTKNKADSAHLQARLKIYLTQKPALLKESLALADTIHRQLDSLMPYTDKAAQKRFTKSLDSLLAKKGCKG